MTVELIRAHIRSPIKHLDIGSSSGAFLEHTAEEFGCVAIGVEPGKVYRQLSEEAGIKTYPSLGDVKERDFDLVSMLHVLEHLPNPVGSLVEIRESLLTHDGYLLIEVPNLYEHEALEFAHLTAYSRATLAETVQQAGYRVIWTKAHGSFRSPVLKLFITLLAVPQASSQTYQKIRSSPRCVAAHRKIGTLKRRVLTRFLPNWTWQAPKVLWDE
jgi:2-polyprenyl-3-methyl-5-hydroxy-6-metoxy-1,4-benzoquinol methylase